MLAAVLVLALMLPVSRRSPGEPRTFVSREATWSLWSVPTDRFAHGASDCRVRRGTVVVWEGRLPFVLHDAVVSRDGIVFATSSIRSADRDGDDGIVLRIDLDGRATKLAGAHRRPRPVHGSPPMPTIELDADERRLTARFAGFEPSRAPMTFDVAQATAREPEELEGSHAAWSADRSYEAPVPRSEEPIDVGAAEHADLVPLGEVELADARDGHDSTYAVDARRRIARYQPSPRRLAVFDATGELVERSVLQLCDRQQFGRIDVAGERWRLVCREGETFVDASGAPESCADARGKQRTRFAVPMSSSSPVEFEGGWLEVTFFDVECYDSRARKIATLERGANLAWFDSIHDAVLLVDGRVLVLVGDGEKAPELHLFDAVGRALWTRALWTSSWAGRGRMRVAGGLVVLTNRESAALVLDPASGRVMRFDPPALFANRRIRDVVPTPDGSELYVFEESSPIVRRFAMPRP